MATQQSYGNKSSYQSRPSSQANTATKSAAVQAASSGGNNEGKGKKPTHYTKNVETKEYVNSIGVWDLADAKFPEDGVSLIVNEALPPGRYKIVRKREKTDA